MINYNELERLVERLDVIREDLLPILAVELEKAGLVLVETQIRYVQEAENDYNILKLNSVNGNTH